MAFKVLFMAHAPDADYKTDNNIIDTGKFKLFSYVVRTQDEAVLVSKKIFKEEKIDSIILCPGFTHSNVAEIVQILDGKVSVNIARGDGPSGMITRAVLDKEYRNK